MEKTPSPNALGEGAGDEGQKRKILKRGK